MVFAGSSPITTTSPSSKAHQKSGSFAPPALPGLNTPMTLSDSRHGRRLRDVEAATLALDGSPPITRTTFPTCRAHYPGGSSGCACRLLPRSCSLPQMAGGSAPALSLSRPAQASLTLRPAGLLNRLKRPLSRGSSPAGYPTEPLVSYQINRQLSGWNLPPLVIRAFGAHCHQRTHAPQPKDLALHWFWPDDAVHSAPHDRLGHSSAGVLIRMTKDKPGELAHDEGKEVPALIASMPASAQERRIAFGVVIFLSVVLAAVIPYAPLQVGRVDAFVPVVHSIICVTDLITAVLLFGQYSIQPQRALLALASGYMCGGLFAFLLTLEFPGAYSATGLLGGGSSGAAWLFNFWRIVFGLAVIAYVLLKDANDTASRFTKNEPSRAIVVTIACSLAVTAGLTWLGTAGNGYLPNLYAGTTQQVVSNQDLAGALWLLNAMALALLLARTRTILDVWLAVTLLMALPDYSLAFFYSALRFSLGWYTARSYALIASFTVLVVLLLETTMLYARLASAITLQRRERAHRSLSVDEATAAIAHEIRQPLGAMSLNTDAALECLKATPLDIEELRSCLTDVKNENIRANEVVAGVRALFKSTARQRTMIEINRLVGDVLRMVEHDLQVHGVSVSTELQEDVPEIMADPTQLQQVVLNLIKNAIEALASGPVNIKAIRLVTTGGASSGVSLYVQDTGPGITPKSETSIFDPFFTTKTSGMGLGLSISRRIIEDHGGDLRLTETSSRGCTFEIVLPGAPATRKN